MGFLGFQIIGEGKSWGGNYLKELATQLSSLAPTEQYKNGNLNHLFLDEQKLF